MKLSAATLTRAGGRTYNEDAVCFEQQGSIAFAALADGLGGHRGGIVASAASMEGARRAFWKKPAADRDTVLACAQQANLALKRMKEEDPSLGRMKTTLVLWAYENERAVWGHVGDSRLYHYRDGILLSKTMDHSLPQKLADIGEITEREIRHHEDRNRLTAVMDGEEMIKWTVAELPKGPARQESFLLCSDGLWEHFDEEEITGFLAESSSPDQWLSLMEKELLRRAPSDHDNYSAVALFLRE